MKIWIDDERPAPSGYDWAKSVNEAKAMILEAEEVVDRVNRMEASIEELPDWCDYMARQSATITLIDIDHDAGDFAKDGGDYIRLLDWLEETERSYPIRIHSMNPVGVENMRRIIHRNGWVEIR